MKIVFRPIKFIVDHKWYSLARFKEGMIDCGWFTIIFKQQNKSTNKIKYHSTGSLIDHEICMGMFASKKSKHTRQTWYVVNSKENNLL